MARGSSLSSRDRPRGRAPRIPPMPASIPCAPSTFLLKVSFRLSPPLFDLSLEEPPIRAPTAAGGSCSTGTRIRTARRSARSRASRPTAIGCPVFRITSTTRSSSPRFAASWGCHCARTATAGASRALDRSEASEQGAGSRVHRGAGSSQSERRGNVKVLNSTLRCRRHPQEAKRPVPLLFRDNEE